MDKETREFLESIQSGINDFKTEMNEFRTEMNDFRIETNKRFDDVENRLIKLEKGQEEIKTIIGELEPLNTSRYLELKNSIDDLKKNLSTVEIVTVSNYADIAKLKSIK